MAANAKELDSGDQETPKGQRGFGPSAAARIRVMKRDRFTCTYCGASGQDAELEIDHIIPVAKGGSHHISNLTTACRSCNQSKGTKLFDRPISPSRPRLDTPTHGLVGLFLHTYKNGEIYYQGTVLSVDDGIALVQLFSWLDGRATNVEPMSVSTLLSEEVKLYSTHSEWISAAERAR